MKRLLLAAIVAMAASGPAWAQSSTTTGTGVGVARSTSSSQAISGQGGTGIVGYSGNTTITSNSPAEQTVRSVPGVIAPGLSAAGLETCLGSISGGGAFVGTGFSFGTTIPDPGCAARLDARTLWSFGLKKAALARLCLNPDINRAMPEVCVKYLPPPAPGYPAPPPVPIRYAQAEASEEQPYTGGDIWLVEGATGKNRLCKDYDVTQQSCRVWAHTVHHSAPKKKATAPAPGYPAPPPVPTRYAQAEASEEFFGTLAQFIQRPTHAVRAMFGGESNVEGPRPEMVLTPYTGGDIWLVDGATGKNRLCNDYDVTQQRCRVWAHTVHHSAPKKKATASGGTSHTAALPAPAHAVAETERKSQ